MSNRGRGGGVCLMGLVHLARPRLKFKTLFHLYFLSAVRQEPDSATVITPIIIKRVTASPKALIRLHSGIFCMILPPFLLMVD
jgi:hypothetical protein